MKKFHKLSGVITFLQEKTVIQLQLVEQQVIEVCMFITINSARENHRQSGKLPTGTNINKVHKTKEQRCAVIKFSKTLLLKVKLYMLVLHFPYT